MDEFFLKKNLCGSCGSNAIWINTQWLVNIFHVWNVGPFQWYSESMRKNLTFSSFRISVFPLMPNKFNSTSTTCMTLGGQNQWHFDNSDPSRIIINERRTWIIHSIFGKVRNFIKRIFLTVQLPRRVRESAGSRGGGSPYLNLAIFCLLRYNFKRRGIKRKFCIHRIIKVTQGMFSIPRERSPSDSPFSNLIKW